MHLVSYRFMERAGWGAPSGASWGTRASVGGISLQEVTGLEIDHCLVFLEGDAHGVATRGHRVELALEQAAQHDDAGVRGCEVLLVVQRDRSLAHHGLVVAGESPMLLLGQLLPQLAIEARAHATELATLTDA